MKYGSLFTGVGGFDLALDRCGMECAWQVEINKWRRKVLEKHWPDVERFEDVREVGRHNLKPVDIICGGDPCQAHSRARGIQGTKADDLSGQFVRVVRDMLPRWVVRENVPAPTCYDFASGIGELGYSHVIIELDSRDFTAQSRCRRFVVGHLGSGAPLARAFPEQKSIGWHSSTVRESEPTLFCLTTHPLRLETRDNCIFEDGRGIRVPTIAERERAQGFPVGWTEGISDSQRVQALGDAVTVNVVEWIGRTIAEVSA